MADVRPGSWARYDLDFGSLAGKAVSVQMSARPGFLTGATLSFKVGDPISGPTLASAVVPADHGWFRLLNGSTGHIKAPTEAAVFMVWDPLKPDVPELHPYCGPASVQNVEYTHDLTQDNAFSLSSRDRCCQECSLNPQCKAYSYCTQGDCGNASFNCFLKSSDAAQNTTRGITSGAPASMAPGYLVPQLGNGLGGLVDYFTFVPAAGRHVLKTDDPPSDHPTTPFDGNLCPDFRRKYCNPEMPLEARISSLMSFMTVNNKMTVLATNSVNSTTFGNYSDGSPLINRSNHWGGDESLHGLGKRCVGDRCATQFPEANAFSSSFNRSFFFAMADVISTEARAYYRVGNRSAGLQYFSGGLAWFSPNVK